MKVIVEYCERLNSSPDCNDIFNAQTPCKCQSAHTAHENLGIKFHCAPRVLRRPRFSEVESHVPTLVLEKRENVSPLSGIGPKAQLVRLVESRDIRKHFRVAGRVHPGFVDN